MNYNNSRSIYFTLRVDLQRFKPAYDVIVLLDEVLYILGHAGANEARALRIISR